MVGGRSQVITLVLSVAALSLGGCGLNKPMKISKDCACGFYTADGGALMHWPEGSRLEFRFAKTFPESLRTSVSLAANVYNQSLAETSIVVDKEASHAPAMKNNKPESVSNDGVNGIYWIDGEWPWEGENAGSDAMTVVGFTKGGIVEADIFFRARSYAGKVYIPSNEDSESTPLTTGNRPSVLEPTAAHDAVSIEPSSILADSTANVQWVYMISLHEFGHALGRVHSDHDDSIMFPTVSTRDIPKPLSDWDFETFGKVYKLRDGVLTP